MTLKEVKSKPTSGIPESRHGICKGYVIGVCLAGLRRPAWRNRAWKEERSSMWDHWGNGGPDCIELCKIFVFHYEWDEWKSHWWFLSREMTWTDSYSCYVKNKQTNKPIGSQEYEQGAQLGIIATIQANPDNSNGDYEKWLVFFLIRITTVIIICITVVLFLLSFVSNSLNYAFLIIHHIPIIKIVLKILYVRCYFSLS